MVCACALLTARRFESVALELATLAVGARSEYAVAPVLGERVRRSRMQCHMSSEDI